MTHIIFVRDPLSICASVVGLITLVQNVATGIEKLASVRKAPAAILALNNDISDLRLVLEETDILLKSPGLPDKNQVSQPTSVVTCLDPILQHARDHLQELEAVCGRLTKPSGTIDRIAWIREQDNVNRIQKVVREARVGLTTILGLITLKSTFRIETKLQEIQSTALDGKTVFVDALVTHSRLLQHTSRQILQSQRLHEKRLEGVEQLLAIGKGASTPAGGMVIPDKAHKLALEDSEFSALRVRFLRRRVCKACCACHCHNYNRFQTPDIALRVLGQLFVGYTGLPALRGPCDLDNCQGAAEGRIQVNYYFPPWFLARIVAFTLKMSPMERPKASLRVLNVRNRLDLVFQGAVEDNADLVKALLTTGKASIMDVTDDSGHSALHLATLAGKLEVVKVLLENGAEPYLENKALETAYDMAWSTILCFEGTPFAPIWRVTELRTLFPGSELVEERRKFTKLHKIVCGVLYADLSKEIKRNPQSIDSIDKDSRTPLSYAAARGDHLAVDILLQHGSNPNIVDSIGQGPLRQSMKAYDSKCTELLIKAGAYIDHRDNWGQTALITAIFHAEPIPFLKILLDAGADINAADISGSTTLMEAMKFNVPKEVQFLLDRKAQVDLVDYSGANALMLGINHNSHAALCILVASTLDVGHSVTDDSGKTILHWAAESGDTETLHIMSQMPLSGLHISDRTDSGLTAIDIAERRHKESLINKKLCLDPEWMQAFSDLLDIIRVATTKTNSPRSIGGESDISDDKFVDVLEHLDLSALLEEGAIRSDPCGFR